MTRKLPRNIPILQENAIKPVSFGVNSIIFSPVVNVFLNPSAGACKDPWQPRTSSPFTIQRTGTFFFTVNELGEYPLALTLIEATCTPSLTKTLTFGLKVCAGLISTP